MGICMGQMDEIYWADEVERRRAVGGGILKDVSLSVIGFSGYSVEVCRRANEWNSAKVKEWARRFREITGG